MNPKRNNITVVDAIMGIGKSSWAINYINTYYEDYSNGYGIFGDRKKFIIIVNTLDEIKRYRDSIDQNNCYIYEPRKVKKVIENEAEIYRGCSKTDSLNRLLADGRNIITTHALILECDIQTRELLIAQNYTLIIDEALQVVERFDIKKDDINLLLRDKVIEIEEKTRLVRWLNDKYDGNETFNELKRLSEKGLIVSFGNDSIFIKKFPESFFECFDEAYILTYLWKGSVGDLYFKIYDIQYKHKSLYNDKLVPYDMKYENEAKRKIVQLLNIYEDGTRGTLNRIGEPVRNIKTGKISSPLCKTWYIGDQNKELSKVLKKNVLNYFKNVVNVPVDEILWTTFISHKASLTTVKTKKESTFAPCNTRGTNIYKHKTVIAYFITSIQHFFALFSFLM